MPSGYLPSREPLDDDALNVVLCMCGKQLGDRPRHGSICRNAGYSWEPTLHYHPMKLCKEVDDISL